MEATGFSLQSEAVLKTLTSDVIKSSEIEGENLSKTQVRSSVARRLGIDIGALAPVDRHVDGVVEMMIDATQNYAEPLTAKRLFAWHSALFPKANSKKMEVGTWRNDTLGPMQVISGAYGKEKVHFEAPAAEFLKHEMKNFIDWFNADQKIDLVLKSAIAHLWFLTIHPFDDGNGRIGRALADMLLARSEQSPQRFYSLSTQICIERNKYYDMLEATQKGPLDITRWIEWFLACLNRAFEGAENILKSVLQKDLFWEKHAQQSLNDRQKKMINMLLDGFEGKLSSSKWAKITKCSQDTALRDIDDLIKREIMLKEPGGGRSTHYELVRS